MGKTVKELREEGWKVRVLHLRRFTYTVAYKDYATLWQSRDVNFHRLPSLTRDWKMEHTGGETRVYIDGHSGRFQGRAGCSDKDPYNKKVGVRLALGRALEQMERHTKANLEHGEEAGGIG